MTDADLAAYIDAAAAVLGFSLTADQRAGVFRNLAILAGYAELLDGFGAPEASQTGGEPEP